MRKATTLLTLSVLVFSGCLGGDSDDLEFDPSDPATPTPSPSPTPSPTSSYTYPPGYENYVPPPPPPAPEGVEREEIYRGTNAYRDPLSTGGETKNFTIKSETKRITVTVHVNVTSDGLYLLTSTGGTNRPSATFQYMPQRPNGGRPGGEESLQQGGQSLNVPAKDSPSSEEEGDSATTLRVEYEGGVSLDGKAGATFRGPFEVDVENPSPGEWAFTIDGRGKNLQVDVAIVAHYV